MVSLHEIIEILFIKLLSISPYEGEAAGLIVTRILIGFLQGPVVACMSSLTVAWFPVEQRGRAVAIITMGTSVRVFCTAKMAKMIRCFVP